MSFADILHWIIDFLLSWTGLMHIREVGWKSLDRKSGQLMREKQPIAKKLKLLLLFNPLTEWLDTTHVMRLYIHEKSERAGKEEGTPVSRKKIKSFVESYGINMDDFEPSDISKYKTFEDFFVRRHRPGSRPVAEPDNPSRAVCVADARVVSYETVAESRRLWIKGSDFSIAALAMDVHLGRRFADGAVASFRLSPQDYHRYHSPVSGRISLYRAMPGDYYQVDPIALQSRVDILTRNAREYVIIETEEFGDVFFVAIGATDVGSVQIHEKWQKPGREVKKGDELGIFQFGGSSIIVAFERGRITFDQDLLDLSRQKIQVSVEVGMSLGVASAPGKSQGHRD